MQGLLILLIFILRISVTEEASLRSLSENMIFPVIHEMQVQPVTPMEALDLVKERYAANFVKVTEGSEDAYYYQLETADLYLVYEGDVEENHDYIIHLYEFVVDDTESGIGHTVTYGWYTVNRGNGVITAKEY